MSTNGTPLIEIEGLFKTYHLGEVDLPVLRGVSFRVAQGEYVALMGSSGSGKSTLMNLLGCLDRPSSGTYRFEGIDVGTLDSDALALMRNEKIGFVFQSFNLLRRTSALDNVMMPLSYSRSEHAEEEGRARATELLKSVGLGDRMDHEPSQLSGGQQQRVAIARALVNRPPLLLADEPTGNLDSHTSEEIMRMFGELNSRGITLVVVTHEPDVAEHAKRVIRLHDGQIVTDSASGTASEPPSGGGR